jgi:hypothetical protein
VSKLINANPVATIDDNHVHDAFEHAHLGHCLACEQIVRRVELEPAEIIIGRHVCGEQHNPADQQHNGRDEHAVGRIGRFRIERHCRHDCGKREQDETVAGDSARPLKQGIGHHVTRRPEARDQTQHDRMSNQCHRNRRGNQDDGHQPIGSPSEVILVQAYRHTHLRP